MANPVLLNGELLTEVKELAAGSHHSVALKNDGTVVAWGADFDGRVTGTPPADANYLTTAIASPVTFGTEVLRGVAAIAAGGGYRGHTVALKSDRTIVAWGANDSGQVTGTVPVNGPDTAIANPVTLGGNVLSGVVAIAAGNAHTVALKGDGSVLAWGDNYFGQTNVPAGLSHVTAIAAGAAHTLALKNDGTVVAWGSNGAGQVTGTPGDDFAEFAAASPLEFQGEILSGVVAIAAGAYHSVALKSDGTIVAWGATSTGPTPIPAEARSGAMAVAAAQNNTYALVVPPPAIAPVITVAPASQTVSMWQNANFTVTATGFPLNYQWRKNGVDIPGATTASYTVKFAQPDRAGVYSVVVSNSAGTVTNSLPAVLTVNPPSPGEVVAWGSDEYGETDVPPGLNEVTAIAAGSSYSMALKADGSVVAWGKMWDGDNNLYVPVSVPIAAQSGIKAISAGARHALALRNDGFVIAWGSNDEGQSSVPLTAQIGVIAIAAGSDHSLALKADGSVVAWGGNIFGQANVPLAAQAGVTAIAAGFWHNLALKNDGSVVAWGRNDAGEVTGIINTGTSNVVSSVVLQGRILTGVVAIACGEEHSVALKQDGSVVAWGIPGAYNGTTEVPFAAQSGVTAIAAGAYHTVALKTDGTLVAWGDNYAGEVTSTPTFIDPYAATGNPVMLEGHVLKGVTAVAAGYDHTLALLGAAPLQPSLSAAASGNSLTLSWPATAKGYKLQSAAALSSGSWGDVMMVPPAENGRFIVAEPMTGGARFYRLVK